MDAFGGSERTRADTPFGPFNQSGGSQLFGTCGGCQYQHMTVAAQRAWKRQHVEDVLRRTGNITEADMIPVNEVFGTEQVLGYRSKITPHHEKPRSVRMQAGRHGGDAAHICMYMRWAWTLTSS